MAARSAPVESLERVALTNPLQVEDVDGTVAFADVGQCVGNRPGRCGRRGPSGRVQGLTAGQRGAERGRMGAACAVCAHAGKALDRDLDVLVPVEEVVDWIAVAAGDDDRGRAALVDPLCELAL